MEPPHLSMYHASSFSNFSSSSPSLPQYFVSVIWNRLAMRNHLFLTPNRTPWVLPISITATTSWIRTSSLPLHHNTCLPIPTWIIHNFNLFVHFIGYQCLFFWAVSSCLYSFIVSLSLLLYVFTHSVLSFMYEVPSCPTSCPFIPSLLLFPFVCLLLSLYDYYVLYTFPYTTALQIICLLLWSCGTL